jgi:hypothetical protein
MKMASTARGQASATDAQEISDASDAMHLAAALSTEATADEGDRALFGSERTACPGLYIMQITLVHGSSQAEGSARLWFERGVLLERLKSRGADAVRAATTRIYHRVPL